MSRRPWKRRPSDTRPKATIQVDVAERSDEFVVTADLPGVRKQDVDLRVRNDRIQIVVDPRGEREGAFATAARERGPLSRTIRLPETVDERRTDADLRHGRLRVTLPKRKRGKSIDVE